MVNRTLEKIPCAIVIAYVIFLFVTSFDAFSMEGALWQQFGMFILYNLPGISLLLFLSTFWKNLLLCGEIFVVLGSLLSLCFLPWEQTITWMLLVMPLLLAGVFYLLLYYWEKHYQFFS